MSCPDQLVVSLAGIASIADAASSQLLSRTRKTYGRIFGEGQPRLSFERDDVFAMRFEMDPPEAAGFGAHDRMARRFNPADALAVWGPQFELAGDTRAQCGRNAITPEWLCKSICEMPEAPPKLASI